MLALIKVGWSLASSRRSSSSARATVVLLAAAVVTFVWLGAVSTHTALGHAAARTAAREPVFLDVDRGDRTRVRDRFDAIDGQQFTVRWIAPVAGATGPPGVDLTQLKRRRFLVSPALAKALRTSGATRFGRAALIGPDGLANPDEMFAYGLLTAPAAEDGWAISGYGRPGDDAEVEQFPFVVATIAFILGPGLLLLCVALGVRSDASSYRCQLLSWFGVQRWQIAAVGSIEAAILVAAGTVAGLTLHRIWSHAANAIPIVRRHVNAGDLTVDLRSTGATVALATLSAAAIAGAITWSRSRPTTSTRPSATGCELRASRLVPFGAGLTVLVTMLALGEQALQIRGLLLAGLLLVAGIPLALPFIGAALGRSLAKREGLVLWMAGRRMERDPRSAMRPLLVTSSALTIGLSVVGYIASVGYEDPPLRAGEVQVAIVHYPRAIEHDVELMQPRRFLLVPFDPTTWQIETTCGEIAGQLKTSARVCEADGSLAPEAQSALARSLTSNPLAGQALRLGPVAASNGPPSAGLAIGASRSGFAEEVRAALHPFDAIEVSEQVEASQAVEPVLVRWLLAGFAIAAIAAVASLCLMTVERYGRSINDQRVLGILGIPPALHWRLEALQFATCASAATALAYGAGTTFAVVMTTTANVDPPTRALAVTAILVVGAVAGCTAAVAIIARIRLKDVDRIGSEQGRTRWTM